MARQLRIEYENAVYHLMARGNRREAIFVDDEDRELFLSTLGQACKRTGFRVYAWVLMDNHYHAVIRTPGGNLVEGMKWLQNTYTRRFNSRHRKWGRLFGDRYKSIVVDQDPVSRNADGPDYLTALIEYVHLNPARARLVGRRSKRRSILDYPWSSVARAYALPLRKRPEWMDVERGLQLYQYRDVARDRRRYVEWLDERIFAEEADRCGLATLEGQSLQSTIRRGWYWGSEAFREKMLALAESPKKRASKRNRNYASSPQGADLALARASAILKKGAKHFGVGGPPSVRRLKRGDRRRVAIAWALCRLTSMPQSWIAAQTGLHSAANVSQQVRRFDNLLAAKLTAKERRWKDINLKFVD